MTRCPRCGEQIADADCAEGCEDPMCAAQEVDFWQTREAEAD